MRSTNKKEQIKIYTVIILAVILVISAYFRFIHAKVRNPWDGTPSKVSLAERPVLPVNREERPINRIIEAEKREITEVPIKDIFVPMLSYQEETVESPEPETLKDSPPLKLRGTIFGDKSAIAIINDQFLRSGDWIGEYRIAQIGKKEVLLDSGDHKIRLEIFNNE
jgi:hypothetical protein